MSEALSEYQERAQGMALQLVKMIGELESKLSKERAVLTVIQDRCEHRFVRTGKHVGGGRDETRCVICQREDWE